MSSSFGARLKISIFGESHGPAIGVVIEGLPAGEEIDFNELQAFLERRAGGKSHTTARVEDDIPEFLSGFLNGKTTGMPVAAIIRNKNVRSDDYSDIEWKLRPSHADFPAYSRFGENFDARGGGHFSGRLTAGLCVAGGIALQILKKKNIEISSHITQIGSVRAQSIYSENITYDDIKSAKNNEIAVVGQSNVVKMLNCINEAKNDGDSVGGVIECVATGLPVGAGEPLFDGIENNVAKIVFGIGAVRGIEFGVGFAASEMRGSQHNDMYKMTNGKVDITTNNSGGVLGGMSTGAPLVYRAAFKPTPTISKTQHTVDIKNNKEVVMNAGGRHDPCIVPRAVPCVEAATAIAVLDLLLIGGLV